MDSIFVTHDDPFNRYHMPHVISGSGFITLCGFVDVAYDTYEHTEHRVNCSICIRVYRDIKALKIPRNYFVKEPNT